MSKPEFYYMECGSTVRFSACCGSPPQSVDVQSKIQTVCGIQLERQEDFVWFDVDRDRVDEAIIELESAGYATSSSDSPALMDAEPPPRRLRR